jgi:hypothetical protein
MQNSSSNSYETPNAVGTAGHSGQSIVESIGALSLSRGKVPRSSSFQENIVQNPEHLKEPTHHSQMPSKSILVVREPPNPQALHDTNEDGGVASRKFSLKQLVMKNIIRPLRDSTASREETGLNNRRRRGDGRNDDDEEEEEEEDEPLPKSFLAITQKKGKDDHDDGEAADDDEKIVSKNQGWAPVGQELYDKYDDKDDDGGDYDQIDDEEKGKSSRSYLEESSKQGLSSGRFPAAGQAGLRSDENTGDENKLMPPPNPYSNNQNQNEGSLLRRKKGSIHGSSTSSWTMNKHPNARELSETSNSKAKEVLVIFLVLILNLGLMIMGWSLSNGVRVNIPPEIVHYTGGVSI